MFSAGITKKKIKYQRDKFFFVSIIKPYGSGKPFLRSESTNEVVHIAGNLQELF
jgi:hypothetical protein